MSDDCSWTSSERLRLLLLQKEGVQWASAAEKMSQEYRERPKNFFNEKNCKAQFNKICNEPCPKEISTDEPTHYKRSAVIDSWIAYLRPLVNVESDRMLETELVEVRKKSELIERIMGKNPPSIEEMKVMLEEVREENRRGNRDDAQIERVERVESAFRVRFNQIFKERRESAGTVEVSIPPGSLSISPTKASNVALQQAFRSPSPIKSPMTSPIRPLAEAIEEADAEMGEMMLDSAEEPKIEVETPVASPLSKTSSSHGKRDKFQDKSSTVSPRTAADRAIGDGGLEEEMESEDEEEPVKEEPMEVDESVGEKKSEKPVSTRKSTRVSTTSVETTPVGSGRDKRKKDASPLTIESSSSKKKDETKEEEGRSRRLSMRGKPPSTPVLHAAPTPTTPLQQTAEEKEEGAKTRRSSRVEKTEEKEEEEGVTKRVTRRSAVEKEGEKTEEPETKEEVTFVAPSVASRTRHHRGSDQVEEKEKEKSEEPSTPKTRAGNRHSVNAKAGSESKESPVATEKKSKRGEKREEETEEREINRGSAGKEANSALTEKIAVAVTVPVTVAGKRDVEVWTEVSIRHLLAAPVHSSPSKTRRGTERESPSTPLARKSSRVSSASSNSGKRDALMASVEVQTEKVEMRSDDEVFLWYNANEKYFNPVCELDKSKNKSKKDKEIKTETDDDKDKPVSRRTRGGEVSEDEGGSRSGSVSQSDKGTPSRRKDSKRDLLTLHLDVDDDTGRYWLANGATRVEPLEDPAGPSSAKKNRTSAAAEITGRRSMTQMDPMKQALFKACKDMELHRHSSVFKANVAQKDAPDYYECVHQPVCLAKMKSDVMDGLIKDPVSLMRQFAIMFMNGAMYNSTAHDYWMYAVEMNKETYKPIREIMPEMMVEEEAPKQTRARRNNEPAFAKDAVLTERDRSMTLDRLFKCESVDADGMETPAHGDDHRALYSRTKVDTTRKRRI